MEKVRALKKGSSLVRDICNTRRFKYDRDLCGLFTHKSVPVIFEPPCNNLDSSQVVGEAGMWMDVVRNRV